MTPYIILFTVPTIIWIMNDKIRINVGNKMLHQTKSLSIDAFMLIFLFLLAFRSISCGMDTKQYLRLYEQYSTSDFLALIKNGEHEIAYKLLNKTTGVIFDNYQFFLAVTAIICVFPLWYFYKKETDCAPLTMALFLSVAPFAMYFSGIRQSIAMSMGILAWYAAKNKKIWWFIVVVLLAVQFHTSAFILFLLYPLYYAKITKKWLWFVVPVMLILYIFRTPVFNYLMQFLWDDYNTTAETGAFMIFLLLILFAVYSYVMVNDGELDQDTLAMRNILLLSVVMQMFAMLHPLSMRMNYYFLIFVPILIPRIATKCKKEFTSIGKLSVVIMIVYFLYHFVMMMVTDNDPLNAYPYVPFWNY